MSTYYAHTRRTTPSSEAGVDYYCPIGTPIRAAGDGRIFETGGSLASATGRYITLDLNDGRRVRYLHLSRYANAFGGARVGRGQIIGYSGASGYGSEYFGATGPSAIPANTGGPHVHVTLWAGHYYKFGRYPAQPTLDFERYVGGSTASGTASPFQPAQTAPPILEEEDDMPGIRIHHQVFTNGNQAYVVETATGFFIPDGSHLAALVKAYEIKLDKLPWLNEYDWNAVQAAKTYSNSGYPQSGATVAQVQAIASAESTAIAVAVEAQLQDEFDAIPGDVADELGDRL